IYDPFDGGSIQGPDSAMVGKKVDFTVVVDDPAKWAFQSSSVMVNSGAVTVTGSAMNYSFYMPNNSVHVSAVCLRNIASSNLLESFDLKPLNSAWKDPFEAFPMSVDYNKATQNDQMYWGNDVLFSSSAVTDVLNQLGVQIANIGSLSADDLKKVTDVLLPIGPRSGFWYGGAGEGQVRNDLGRLDTASNVDGAVLYYPSDPATAPALIDTLGLAGFGRTLANDVRNDLSAFSDWDATGYDAITVWAGEFSTDKQAGSSFTLTLFSGASDDVNQKKVAITIKPSVNGVWERFDAPIPAGFGKVSLYTLYVDSYVPNTGELWVDDIYAVKWVQ
ncbi:MAG: hypothetical protein FWF29_05900, partial [Treponema sp.]|nr:hypothetical protein [Treponema sp.]